VTAISGESTMYAICPLCTRGRWLWSVFGRVAQYLVMDCRRCRATFTVVP
jgi:hypothetical protein